jgi:hypothetical protein
MKFHIKTVILTKPKVLIGFTQKGQGKGIVHLGVALRSPTTPSVERNCLSYHYYIGHHYINRGIVSHENESTPRPLKPNNVFETSHLSIQI